MSWLLESLDRAGSQPRPQELWGRYTAICPCCRVRTLEVSILPADAAPNWLCWRGEVRLRCLLGGCDSVSLKDALGLSLVELLPDSIRLAA